MGAQPPPIPYILGNGVNYLTLRVQFYANECKEGRDTNPNECNSTLTSGTKNIYPYPIDVNDRGHRFRSGSPVTNYPCAPSNDIMFRQTENSEWLVTRLLGYSPPQNIFLFGLSLLVEEQFPKKISPVEPTC